MKFNRIIILCFILLAVFLVGFASAAENITDDVMVQEDANEIAVDDAIDEIPDAAASDETDILANESPESAGDINQSEIASEINVTFEEQMWRYNLSDIRVELPENASGVFSLKIGSETIYNETITNKTFSIPVKMPSYPRLIFVNKWPSDDFYAYGVTAFYNDIELNINRTIHFMLNAPDNYNIITVPSEILQDAIDRLMPIQLPYSANGVVKVYVDGKLINCTNATGYWFYYNTAEVTSLGLGNHTMSVCYSNDTYYAPKNVTTSFLVTNVLITIPDTIYINHDTCVTVRVLNTVTGEVYVYVDGKRVYKSEIKNGDFLLSLEDYLRCNSSEVTVAFMGDYTRTLTKKINITYDFGTDYARKVFEVGKEENIIDLWLPDNFNNSLVTVTIDGVKYPIVRPAYMMNNWVEVDISNVGVGNHTCVVSYPGDDMFMPRTESFNFTVIYAIDGPDWYIEFKDSSSFCISLPSDADGNLSVYIGVNDSVLYKTVKLVNGKASVRVDDLAPKEYYFRVEYTGDDYDIDGLARWYSVGPKVALNQYFTAGSNEYLVFEVPKSCMGNITVKIGSKVFKRNVVNGTAKIALKDFKAGEYEVEILYSIDGYDDCTFTYFTVVKPKIQVKSVSLYTTGAYATVKILNNNGKAMANQVVTLNVGGKKINAKTNSKGIATFKLAKTLQYKNYKMSISCNGATLSKTLLAKHALSLNAVKVKASAKSLVLTATLKEGKNPIKSKVVAFKFNGKIYKVKTNSKGVAKVTVSKSVLSKLKAGEKVTYQVTYLKDTVKRSASVLR